MNLRLEPGPQFSKPGNPAEKRREPRRAGSGAVRIQLGDRGGNPAEITGRLVDVSHSGFRMAHACKTLTPGQIVEFAHVYSRGRARVVWTRIVGRNDSGEPQKEETGRENAVESGFFVLEC